MATKYRSKPIVIDGHRFPSQREGARYLDLKLLQKQGVISDLKLQPRYPVVVNGVKVCTIVPDFDYIENGQQVTEDSKGMVLPLHRLKAKLFRALYGREILIT